MDREVVEAIEKAGIDTTFEKSIPVLGIQVDGRGSPIPLGDEVTVVAGEESAVGRLRRISDLWTGDARPPDFADGPTREYVMFFAVIERTAADYCSCTGKRTRDQEFERLYNHLRRRPDGADGNPLFSYLQAAARLHMSLRDGSRAEFEAVARRLTRSARTFSEGYASTNYLDLALTRVLEAGA